jgi:hypothetical protein
MSTLRVVGLAVVVAACAVAASVLGLLTLNEVFFHGFSLVCSDGYPRTEADEAACGATWTAGLPYAAATIGVVVVGIAALLSLVRHRRSTGSSGVAASSWS